MFLFERKDPTLPPLCQEHTQNAQTAALPWGSAYR